MTALGHRVGRIHARDLGALATYRGLPGWSLRPDTNGISWLKVPTGDEEIFRKLPLLGRWTSDTSGKLTREGKLLSVAGGGDTVAALNASGAAADFSYVSTAGGAFLEWLEGKTLPGVAALEA